MRHRTNTGGFTLVEIMMALALLALLMASVGAAMQGSLASYAANEKVAAATQTARAVLNRISRDIRTAKTDPTNNIDVTWNGQVLSIKTPDDPTSATEIQYQRVGNNLTYRRLGGNAPVDPAQNLIASTDEATLSNFAVTRAAGTDSKGKACTTCITVELDLTIGGVTYPMTATASPRCNQSY